MESSVEGVFQITGWDESPYSESDDGSKQSHAKITQEYTGAIEGSSNLQYLMSYQSESSAIFVGLEKIEGSFNGKAGSFMLQHNGKFENGVASSEFFVVPNSGKGELVAIDGSGSFKSGENGKANYIAQFSA